MSKLHSIHCTVALTIYSYTVALSDGPVGLKLCGPGSQPVPLHLRWRNNHAVWSRHISGSQTRRKSMSNAPRHTVLAIQLTYHASAAIVNSSPCKRD